MSDSIGILEHVGRLADEELARAIKAARNQQLEILELSSVGETWADLTVAGTSELEPLVFRCTTDQVRLLDSLQNVEVEYSYTHRFEVTCQKRLRGHERSAVVNELARFLAGGLTFIAPWETGDGTSRHDPAPRTVQDMEQ